MRRAQAARAAAAAAADETAPEPDGGTAAPATVLAFLNATTAQAAMVAAAAAPATKATPVGTLDDDSNMQRLITQPDGMEEDGDNKDDNNKNNDEDDGEEQEDAATGDGAATTVPAEMLLLVDAANGFNNLSRYSMLWTVRHRCPRLACLTFNCYRHQVRPVCRQPGGKPEIILSKDGVTQVDPLVMALYGIALTPLVDILQENFPDVLQLWYADDAATKGPPDRVAACFKILCDLGPMLGYFPESEKSFAICPLATETEVKTAFAVEDLAVKTCRGHRYVYGYVVSLAMKNRWIKPMVEKWVGAINMLAKVAE